MNVVWKTTALTFFAACLLHAAPASAQSATASLTVSGSVAAACRFYTASGSIAVPLDATSLLTFGTQTSLSYRCTTGTVPSFTPTGGTARTLTTSGGDTISYNLAIGTPVAGTGFGAGQDKSIAFQANIAAPGVQNAKPGAYSDTVAITIAVAP